MTVSQLTQLARDLKRKGLSLLEIARELGTNVVWIRRLLQPELFNALEPDNGNTINSIKRYTRKRQREDSEAA